MFATWCTELVGCLSQAATPDKTLTDASTSEQPEKFALHKPSPASSSSSGGVGRRLSASTRHSAESQKRPPRRSSDSKCSQSSAAKRLQYTASGPGPVRVNGHARESPVKRSVGVNGDVAESPVKEAVTTTVQCSPLRSPRRAVNGTSPLTNAVNSHDISPTRMSAVSHSSPEEVTIKSELEPEVTNRSSKVISRSPKVVSRSPKVINRSPKVVASSTPSPARQRQLFGGDGSVKRGGRLLVSPAGQPRTKKFIVERLRNAKTSRRQRADVAAGGHKYSPVRRSPQQRVSSGTCFYSSVFTVTVACPRCVLSFAKMSLSSALPSVL